MVPEAEFRTGGWWRVRASACSPARFRLGVLALLPLVLGVACSGAEPLPAPSPSTRTFRFLIRGIPDAEGRFVASTSNAAVLARIDAELVLPPAERRLHIHGPIALGDGGQNTPWHWHFVPDAWDMVEASIEVCDGTPAMVEDDPAAWLDKVGVFCPWASFVDREL